MFCHHILSFRIITSFFHHFAYFSSVMALLLLSYKCEFITTQRGFVHLHIWCPSPHVEIALPLEPVWTSPFSVPLCPLCCCNSNANLNIPLYSAWHGFACLPVVCASLPNPKVPAAFSFVCVHAFSFIACVVIVKIKVLQWDVCTGTEL